MDFALRVVRNLRFRAYDAIMRQFSWEMLMGVCFVKCSIFKQIYAIISAERYTNITLNDAQTPPPHQTSQCNRTSRT